MKRFAVLLVSVCWVVELGTVLVAQDAGRTWISDVTIISPENLDHISTGSVLIEGGKIMRVERQAGAKAPEHVTVISGKGQFLIPGLIDSHVHLSSIPGMGIIPDQVKLNEPISRSFPQHEPMVADYVKQMPRSYLYYGYTTLIDLVAPAPQELNDFRHEPLHPDLYSCNPAMPFANGYPMSYAPPELRFKLFPNFIYDPAQAASIPAEYKPEDHTPAADVARVKASGGICVKTFFERGFGGMRNLPVMSPEVLAEVRKAATADGLVLMMHANSFEAQKFGVDGNVDVLAHGMWNWGKLDEATGLPDEIKKVLDEIVEKKIGYQPTIQVLAGLGAYFDPEYLKMPGIPKVVPAEMIEWFQTPEGQWFKKEVDNSGRPDAAVLNGVQHGPIHHVQLVVGYLASKNANFLFGTDTPSAPTYGNLPGLNGYLEMQQLRKAGMSLEQIFKAATVNNAREFKLDSQVGTIEAGKVANLVLLRKSPLESVDAYDSIVTVWVHGVGVPRESLAVPAAK